MLETKRYVALSGLNSSFCGGLFLSAMAFFADRAEKVGFKLSAGLLGFYLCSEVSPRSRGYL